MGSYKKIMVRAKASARKSPAAGSSKEAKINDQVEVYRKEMCAKAQALLESTIPNKLEFLCQLLQGEKWQSDYSVKAREFCIESIEQYEKDVEEARSGQNGQEENIEELDGGDIEDEDAAEGPSSAKQIKLGENSSTLSIELKEKSQPSKQPKIEVNQINLELSNILKPELIALGIHCQILRDWIPLHTPKHEDGNNFGVEVQGETIQELAAVTEDTQSTMEEQSAHHLARANIMEKIAHEGCIKDLKVFIYEEDEKYCRKLRLTALNLRTHYCTVLDTITKNYEKITNPKGSQSNHTLMY